MIGLPQSFVNPKPAVPPAAPTNPQSLEANDLLNSERSPPTSSHSVVWDNVHSLAPWWELPHRDNIRPLARWWEFLPKAMTTLHLSISSLSLANSLFGQRLCPPLCACEVQRPNQPCQILMKLKRWERKECKPNSLPVLHKMHVKVGDTVKVISGRDKGKIGEISQIFKHNSTVIVKDINMKTKHMKSREEGQPGQIVKVEAPVHSSNVMLYSTEKQVASRVGHKILEDGSRVRYLLKTGEVMDSPEKWLKAVKDKKKDESSS